METRLREDMSQLRGDVKQLGDRVARLEHGQAKLEGLLEGFAPRPSPDGCASR